MDELGTILRETRAARGQTLADVAHVTRIRVRYLEALEEGRYDALPTPVHVWGFMRNYALYLKLDPEPLIARYKAGRRVVQDIPPEKQVRQELDKAPSQPPETVDLNGELEDSPVFFRPVGGSLQAPAWFSGDILVGAFILVALLALLYWAGSRFLIPAITGVRATETPVAETTRLPTRATAAAAFQPTRISTPLAPEPTIPSIFSSIQLQVVVRERSWMQVVVDNEIVQEGLAQAGDIYAWDGQELVKLRTGNAAGLDVTLNGQELGLLGTRGQVVEKIWGLSGQVPPTPMPTSTATEPPPPTVTPTPAGG